MSDVSSNPLQLIEQTEMKPLIEGCVKKALLSYCKGTPAKIPWPHRVLHDAVRRIEELESELAAARTQIALYLDDYEQLCALMLRRDKDLAAAREEIARTKELARKVCDEVEELRSKDARRILGMSVIAHKGEEK
jgi:hypothetical protein